MRTVHWLGAGLSSGPGVRHLSRSLPKNGVSLRIWARDQEKLETFARQWAGPQKNTDELRELSGSRSFVEPTPQRPRALQSLFTPHDFQSLLNPGDIAISMFPATEHPMIGEICARAGVHLVTSSYVPKFNAETLGLVRSRELVFINEAGLDPGIDHLFAHELVSRLTAEFDPAEVSSVWFNSHCGGMPAQPSAPWYYRFSWSPLGVLRATRNEAKWIEEGKVRTASPAWYDTRPINIGEHFYEMYPNRDSTSFIEPYLGELVQSGTRIEEFRRGTLRSSGWREAWGPVLRQAAVATEVELQNLASRLHSEAQYHPGERDRCVLSVELRARSRDGRTWTGRAWLDESGDALTESAMSRTVSLTTATAVESLLAGELRPGVQGAPGSRDGIAGRWLERLGGMGIGCRVGQL